MFGPRLPPPPTRTGQLQTPTRLLTTGGSTSSVCSTPLELKLRKKEKKKKQKKEKVGAVAVAPPAGSFGGGLML